MTAHMLHMERLNLLVMGKTSISSFQRVKSLEINYSFSSKAWMTLKNVIEWITKLEKKLMVFKLKKITYG